MCACEETREAEKKERERNKRGKEMWVVTVLCSRSQSPADAIVSVSLQPEEKI